MEEAIIIQREIHPFRNPAKSFPNEPHSLHSDTFILFLSSSDQSTPNSLISPVLITLQ